jgi:Zn-finger domain-containing protein
LPEIISSHKIAFAARESLIDYRDLSPSTPLRAEIAEKTKLRDAASYLATATFVFGKKLFFTLATIT